MRKLFRGLPAVLAAVTAVAAAALAQGGAQGGASASLKDKQGNAVGQVTFTQLESGVVIRGELQNLPPGWHGIHIHAVGKCEPDFAAAGGHFNPSNTKHGLAGPAPHAGDLPNIFVADNGRAMFEAMSGHISVKQGGGHAGHSGSGAAAPGGAHAASIFDQDGAAIVVHAKADDYRTDPAGDSGDRIACGVIQQR